MLGLVMLTIAEAVKQKTFFILTVHTHTTVNQNVSVLFLQLGQLRKQLARGRMTKGL